MIMTAGNAFGRLRGARGLGPLLALLLAVFLVLAESSPAHAQNAMGVPVVTGVLEEGLTAAADVTGISDADGLTNVSYSYEWMRVDGGADTPISGATDATYVMQAVDVDKALKVRVTFTDDAANPEMRTSDASAIVASAPTTYLVKNLTQAGSADLSITTETPDGADMSANGDAYAQPFTVGDYGVTLQSVRLLVGVDTGVEPRVSIQWDDPGMPRGTPLVTLTNPTGIDGSTATVEEFTTDGFVLEANTLYWLVVEKLSGTGNVRLGATTTTDDDADPEQGWSVGDAAQVRASGTATFSNASPTTVVKVAVLGEQVANVAATSTLSIAGIFFEANLALHTSGLVTDANGTYNAQYAYQWFRVDGVTETEISDATDSSYTIQSADVAKTLKVRLTFTDDAGYPETLFSPATPTIQAAESYLVSNLGQAGGTSTFRTRTGLTAFAQPFMTGSAGATLNKVKLESIVFGEATVTAEIWSDNSGRPGSNLHTFGVNSGVTLLANTKYWLIVQRVAGTDNFNVTVNRIAGTDAGGAAFWSIDDNIWYYWESSSLWVQYRSFTDPSAVFVMRMGLQLATEGGLAGIRVDRPGMVTLSRPTPAVNAPLTATLTDPDGVTGETWTWSWAETSTGAFTIISGANTATYTPVTDDLGRFLKASVSYTDPFGEKSGERVSDNAVTNSPPVFDDDSLTVTVNENATTGTVSTVTATDPDGDTITYSVGGADEMAFNEDFSLDTSNGEITVNSDATIDHESKPSYSVAITAADPYGGADTVALTINVTDVDEPGTVTLSRASPAVGIPLTAALTDPDGGVTGEAWTWSWSTTFRGSFTTISGANTASYTPVSGDLGRYLKASVSYTDSFGSGKSASRTKRTVRNPPPVFDVEPDEDNRNLSYIFTVTENVTSGTVGTVTATDPDGETITYSMHPLEYAQRDFSVNASTGEITVRSDATINYEAGSLYNVAVYATDPSGGEATAYLIINVTDADDPGFFNWSRATPVVDRSTTVWVRDEDGYVPGIRRHTTFTYTYSWSTTPTGPFTTYTIRHPSRGSDHNSANFAPVAGDVGRYVKATVSYTDTFGEKRLEVVFDNPVAADVPQASITGILEVGLMAMPSFTQGDVIDYYLYARPDRYTHWAYQWISVDGDSETVVYSTTDRYDPSYRIQEADVGKRLKLRTLMRENGDPTTERMYTSKASDVVRGASSYLGSNLGETTRSSWFGDGGWALGFTTGDVPAELAAVRMEWNTRGGEPGRPIPPLGIRGGVHLLGRLGLTGDPPARFHSPGSPPNVPQKLLYRR